MDNRRLALIALLLPAAVATVLIVLIALAGCESRPTDPVYDNPFDPAGPDGGDPLDVQATATDTSVIVTWSQPDHPAVASYTVLHSLSYSSNFLPVGTVERSDQATASFVHNGVEPTRSHYYRVRAESEDGETSIVSEQVAAVAATSPLVSVSGGASSVASRQVELAITATRGDSLRIADNDTFGGALVTAITAPGQPEIVAWDLGPAAANDEEKRIHVQAFSDTYQSPVAQVTATVAFSPAFTAAGGADTVGTRAVDLSIAATGVDSMRFALSEAALAQQPWRPGAETRDGFPLADSANPQTVYGEFLSDFGFTAVTTWTAIPDPLTDVSFRLVVPPDHVVDQSVVEAASDAAATQLRISEDPDFASAAWQPYADTIVFRLSSGAGRKIVYAQYRNDWAQSGIYSDYVDYLSQPLEVIFLAPPDGAIVRAGTRREITGLALVPSGASAVDSVKIDTGDGAGFRPVAGLSYWTFDWDVPDLEADTERLLRVRAWAQTDSVISVTEVLAVTVTRLAISIDEPTDGAQVAGGSTESIGGTAKPALDGAAIDSVTVYADDQRLPVTGIDAWSTTWLAPEVGEATPAEIVATVHASGETAADTVAVEIVVP